jgi:hypothetical protein
MQQPSEIKILKEELAKQQQENNFLARELEALKVTVRGLEANRDAIVSGFREPVYVPPKVAARGTTLDPGTIRKWCATGEVDCEKRQGRWYVNLMGKRTQLQLTPFRQQEKVK